MDMTACDTDFLLRGLCRTRAFRFMFAETTATTAAGIIIHDADPVAGSVFARALTAAALTAPLLEANEKYSLRWEYPGKIATVIADVNAQCDVRGILKAPHIYDQVRGENDVYGEKDGMISVIKSADGRVLSSGSAKARLGEIVADTAFFFSASDQIETEMYVAVKFQADAAAPVDIAAGLMVQAMPGCDLKKFEPVRRRLNSSDCHNLLLLKMPSEKKLRKLLELILAEKYEDIAADVAYNFGPDPGFRCGCTAEKIKQALTVLGKEELDKLYVENPRPTVRCEFCKQKYSFRRDEINL